MNTQAIFTEACNHTAALAAEWHARGRAAYDRGHFTYDNTPRNSDDAATCQRITQKLYEQSRLYRDEAAARAPEGIEVFFKAYVKTALWSANDNSDEDGGDPLDKNYSVDDLDDECRASMLVDCTRFLRRGAEHIGDNYSQAGHDFWLTRCGHGTGFWDADEYGDTGDVGPHAEALDKAAKAYGNVDLGVTEGKIYSN